MPNSRPTHALLFASAAAASLTLAPLSDVFAYDFTETLRPASFYEALVPPLGSFDSVAAAFTAVAAAYSNSCTYPLTCELSNLRPCAQQTQHIWGEPTQWCWDWKQFYFGQPWRSGTNGTGISLVSVCPHTHSMVNIVTGTGTVADPRRTQRRCELRRQPKVAPKECGKGNPIYPDSGTKAERFAAYTSGGDGSLFFEFSYSSSFRSFRNPLSLSFVAPNGSTGGPCKYGVARFWDQSIGNYTNRVRCFEEMELTPNKAVFTDLNGVREELTVSNGAGESSLAYRTTQLRSIQYAGNQAWLLSFRDENRMMVFDALGRVLLDQNINGRAREMLYAADGSVRISNQHGRAIFLSSASQPSVLTDPAGSLVLFEHAETGLNKVTFQDGTSRSFFYDEPNRVTNPAIAGRLTGILDEKNVRYASFSYEERRAVSTERAGGVGKYSIVDGRTSGAGTITLVDPIGTTQTMMYAVQGGLSRAVSSNQASGSGCSSSTSASAYDPNGNLARRDDFNGNRTCFFNDPQRNLELVRIEGQASALACDSSSELPANARKVSTIWHPEWRLPVKVAEPGRITTFVYNGQPDVFDGNVVASCAPAGAMLPDGKPLVLLCRQVEQATTDANGSSAFATALQSKAPLRQQSWTYNRFGQVLTHDGPRTDIADVTTYVHYSDTAFAGAGNGALGHFVGDLQSVTNAEGKITQYVSYDKHGHPREVVDPNGVTTNYNYDARQRLISSSTAGETTVYEYWPTGLLRRVTQPDGSFQAYGYDDAHRLVSVTDNLGNSVTYTLDNLGNRTAEEVKDPGNVLRRALARSIDALGRVQQVTGRE
jgi:YD repeat-containing protein